MYSSSSISLPIRAYTASSHTWQRTDRLMAEVFLALLSINIVLLPWVFTKVILLHPIPPLIAVTSSRATITVGTATANLMRNLGSEGLLPLAVKNITRKPFPMGGLLVTLNGDNFEAFEYPDHDSALKDAATFSLRYAPGTQHKPGDKYMHAYVNDTVVILYYGNQDAILSSLERNAGISMI